MSVERIYVVDDIADEFIGKVVDNAKALRQGAAGEFDVGSICMERQIGIIDRHVVDAREKGATIHTGGRRNPDLKGLFYEPTVISGVTHDMLIAREETFGPVMPIIRVKTEEEALELANDTDYGLTASVWTKDIKKGESLARRINAGSVVINDASLTYGILEAQFGGVKNSGVGRVNGAGALHAYCYEQPIIIDRFGRDTEPNWYPFTLKDYEGMQKALKFLYKTPIGRRMA